MHTFYNQCTKEINVGYLIQKLLGSEVHQQTTETLFICTPCILQVK